LRCPEPILILAAKSPQVKPGEILEIIGDCPTFERDIRRWCERLHKLVLSVQQEEDGRIRCQIQL